jgi:hypothetical protein
MSYFKRFPVTDENVAQIYAVSKQLLAAAANGGLANWGTFVWKLTP